MRKKVLWLSLIFTAFFCVVSIAGGTTWEVRAGGDLKEVLERGELRHLGGPYGNFVTGVGDGFSVDLMRGFASYLGVRYRFVPVEFTTPFHDLLGREISVDRLVKKCAALTLGKPCPIRGDVLSFGMTMLSWRKRIVAFSDPTFITQIWLVVPSAFPLTPIVPSGSISEDVVATVSKMRDLRVLGWKNSAMDPAFFCSKVGYHVVYSEGSVNAIIPALLKGEGEGLVLPMTDALMGLRRWPGKIKVIGPVSLPLEIGCAFRPESPELRKAFNNYLEKIRRDGIYLALVTRYYPDMLVSFPDFFKP